MEGKTFYVTTPIYYPSDNPHIGHCYTTVVSDALARYKRMQGYDVMFLTGTDEHGQKIETKATEAGQTPKAYVDKIVARIQELWARMGITYDRYIRTTDDYHIESVQKIFRKLYDKGEIYKSVYKGAYCKPCESFWTDTQLKDGKCPDCGREVEQAEEESYFFRLSNYTDRILKLYEENPGFLQPQTRVNEMVNNFLKPGLDDLCVSRTSFTWGVPVDFDPGHVVYVWVDALSNYITALGYGNGKYHDFDRYWPADVHLMAKEIIRFHAIIWPALLMALELPLPKKVYGHGWLLFGGDKMSKSKGNVVDPFLLIDRYGADALRYFLLREVPFGQDGNFTNEALIARINSDLANDLGNLVSRSTAMAAALGALPTAREIATPDDELTAMATALLPRVEGLMDDLQFPTALTEIFRFISRTNKYIDETMPWALAKDETKRARHTTVLYNLLESIRVIAVLIAPFMPDTSAKILAKLGLTPDSKAATWQSAGIFGLLPADIQVQKGEALFPRIDIDKELAALDALGAPKTTPSAAPANSAGQSPAEKPEGVATVIDIAEFAKVELRVAEITACEPVPKADKLLKLTLDDGMGGRQVASGIRQWYQSDDLIGKKIVVVANLKPAKIRGVESNGMILAADVGDSAKVLFVDDSVPVGAKIR